MSCDGVVGGSGPRARPVAVVLLLLLMPELLLFMMISFLSSATDSRPLASSVTALRSPSSSKRVSMSPPSPPTISLHPPPPPLPAALGTQPTTRARSSSSPISPASPTKMNVRPSATLSRHQSFLPNDPQSSRGESSSSSLSTSTNGGELKKKGRARSASLVTVKEVGGGEGESDLADLGSSGTENWQWVDAKGELTVPSPDSLPRDSPRPLTLLLALARCLGDPPNPHLARQVPDRCRARYRGGPLMVARQLRLHGRQSSWFLLPASLVAQTID